MNINLEKKGLAAVFKPWQLDIIHILYKNNQPYKSREIHEQIGGTPKASRASVINFLNYLRDEGLLQYEVGTAKGGVHGIYQGGTTVSGLWSEIKARTLLWLADGEQKY